MNLFSFFLSLIPESYHFFSWRDAIEIFFFSAICYGIASWLKKDTQKNLIGYFYTYSTLIIGSYMLELSTMYAFLMGAMPVLAILFILVHQETLQRNFVTLKNSIHVQRNTTPQDWLETLMRTALINIHENKPFYCVIESSDQLTSLIDCPVTLNTQLDSSMLDLLQKSSLFDYEKMLWVNNQGALIGINAQWHVHGNESWHSNSTQALPEWQQDALLMTAKTDAAVIHCDPQSGTFWMVVNQKIYKAQSASMLLSLLKKYIFTTHKEKGFSHDHQPHTAQK